MFDRFATFWRRQEELGTWVRLERAAEAQIERSRQARRAAKAAEKAAEEAEKAAEASREAAERASEAVAAETEARRELKRPSETSDSPGKAGETP